MLLAAYSFWIMVQTLNTRFALYSPALLLQVYGDFLNAVSWFKPVSTLIVLLPCPQELDTFYFLCLSWFYWDYVFAAWSSPRLCLFKRVYTNWIPCFISSLSLQCLTHSRTSETFLVEIPKGITLAALTSCHLYLGQSALRKTKAINHFSFTNTYIFSLLCEFSHERIIVQSKQNNSCLHS